jgi:CRP-like cAMP-binding protein
MPDIFIKSGLFDPVKQKYLMFGHLKTGDMFSEQCALNDIVSSYSVVACSAKVEYYKIHRSHFLQHFGGNDGNQVNDMRARMILRNNWFMSKISMIEVMGIQTNLNLEFAS